MNTKRLWLLLTSRKAVEKQERGPLYPVSGPPSRSLWGVVALRDGLRGMPSGHLRFPERHSGVIIHKTIQYGFSSESGFRGAGCAPTAGYHRPRPCTHVLARPASGRQQRCRTSELPTRVRVRPSPCFCESFLSHWPVLGQPSRPGRMSQEAGNRRESRGAPSRPAPRHAATLLAECFAFYCSLKGQSLHKNIK